MALSLLAGVRAQLRPWPEDAVYDRTDRELARRSQLDGVRVQEPLELQPVHDGEDGGGCCGDGLRVAHALLCAELLVGPSSRDEVLLAAEFSVL